MGEPSTTIRRLRERLGMTQAQLASRVGVPQSFIAKIETGRTDPRVSTLRRVFEALYCDPDVLPRPRQPLDQVLQERARKVAEVRVDRVFGTMALERQEPNAAARRKMIDAEAARLRDRPHELWEEP